MLGLVSHEVEFFLLFSLFESGNFLHVFDFSPSHAFMVLDLLRLHRGLSTRLEQTYECRALVTELPLSNA